MFKHGGTNNDKGLSAALGRTGWRRRLRSVMAVPVCDRSVARQLRLPDGDSPFLTELFPALGSRLTAADIEVLRRHDARTLPCSQRHFGTNRTASVQGCQERCRRTSGFSLTGRSLTFRHGGGKPGGTAPGSGPTRPAAPASFWTPPSRGMGMETAAVPKV